MDNITTDLRIAALNDDYHNGHGVHVMTVSHGEVLSVFLTIDDALTLAQMIRTAAAAVGVNRPSVNVNHDLEITPNES